MKKAIDNYARGKQIEVTAWKGQSIPASTGRFFCPECMESVALDIRGHFRHKMRTEQSIECENRVDSPSQTAYERMGLPVFIRKESDYGFKLYLGFPPLPQSVLNDSANKKAAMSIGDGRNFKLKFGISNERFDSEHTTYIPMDFVPMNGGKYQIQYVNTPGVVKNRWTDYSDVWGSGQFFKVSEGYARKIRQLGTIVADQDYYFIGETWYFRAYTKYIDIEAVGGLHVGNRDLKVNKINIHVNKTTDLIFHHISTMLMEKYHLSLLIAESTLSPIWPPCLEEDNYFIYPVRTKSAILLVNSSNDAPSIYRYQGNEYSEIQLEKAIPPLLDIRVTEEEIPLSIDRAFNGNIQYLRKQSLRPQTDSVDIDIVDEEGNSVFDNPPQRVKGKVFLVRCNCPGDVYLLHQNGSSKLFKLGSEDGVAVDDVNWNDSIVVISNVGRLLISYTFEHAQNNLVQEDGILLEKIRKARGPVMQVNSQVLSLYRSTANTLNVKHEVEKYIRIGIIPVQVVKLLKEEYGGI